MIEQTREKIIETLRGEALGDPETGWLSDLSRRGLTWDERDEVIAVGEWFGSVDVGHLAGIVESIISKHTEERTARLEQAEQAVARVREVAAGWATNDRPFREAILRALDGDQDG